MGRMSKFSETIHTGRANERSVLQKTGLESTKMLANEKSRVCLRIRSKKLDASSKSEGPSSLFTALAWGYGLIHAETQVTSVTVY